MGRKNTGKKQRLSEYAMSKLPAGSVIQFVFYEDFDQDGLKEAVIGITRFSPFPPDSAILIIKKNQDAVEHSWLNFCDSTGSACGVIDNAAAADTDGDGRPELIVSQVLSHEHDIDITVFDWLDSSVHRVWHSEKSFFHGSMEVDDIDGDGVAEIVVENGTHGGSEVIAMKEACYHVREGCAYKWDGNDYHMAAYQVRMPYISYNAAVDFLKAIWLRDYDSAYDMVVMPGFLGLAGLDDSSVTAFRNYIDKKVLPALTRNISKSKLVPLEPYDTYCQFTGSHDCFTVELARVKNRMKVLSLAVAKRVQ